MGKPAWVGLVSAIVLAFICGGIYAFNERSHVAEAQLDPTVVGVDANPTGNTATHVHTIDSCISVNLDDVFYIDLFVMDVTNLNAWDAIFEFDELLLEVNSLAVADFFLGNNVYNPFYCYPDGVCQVGGGDQSGAGHTDEGVLGRLEITAIGAGISEANLDLRPPVSLVTLRDPEGTFIGDDGGDGYFDGPILNAEIRVDQPDPCPGECHPGAIPPVDTDGDTFTDDVETYLPTDCVDDCPNNPSHDAWPPDINADTYVTVGGDILSYRGNIGASVTNPTLQRLDLNMDGFITVGGDVLPFRGQIGKTCS